MSDLLDRLAHHGLTDEHAGAKALRATLAVLGERLVDDEARALASVMPLELAKIIETVEYDADFGTPELFERVRRRLHTNAGSATETAEIALAAIGECLGADLRVRIARGLPEQAAGVLRGRPEPGEPPPYRDAPRKPRSSTLASSRPGSSHPVCESAPPAGHTHSVARNPSPHAETKLSAARGTTQERFEETLGTGRAPSGR